MSCGSDLHHRWVDVTTLGEMPLSRWICSECGIPQPIEYHTIIEPSLTIPITDGSQLVIGPMDYGETHDYTVGDVRHVVHRVWKS